MTGQNYHKIRGLCTTRGIYILSISGSIILSGIAPTYGNHDTLKPKPQEFLQEPSFTLNASWDFGTVNSGDTVTHTFDLTNSNATSLLILGIGSSCACLSGQIDKFRLEANDSARLKATLNPTENSDSSDEYIYVDTYSDKERSEVFRIKHQVNPKPTPILKFVSPVQTLGLMRVGQTVKLDLTVQNTGDTDLIIFSSNVDSSPDFSWVPKQPSYPVTVQPAEKRVFAIAYTPDSASGVLQKRIFLVSNDPTDKFLEASGYIATEEEIQRAMGK